MTLRPGVRQFGLAGLTALSASASLTAHAADEGMWQVGAQAAYEVSSNSLPVTRLDGPWGDAFKVPGGRSRSFGEFSGAVFARHASGWEIAATHREQAGLESSQAAVRLFAAYHANGEPDSPGTYPISANFTSWSGNGLRISSPALHFSLLTATPWAFTPTLEMLSLNSLRQLNLAGDVNYLGMRSYSFAGLGEQSGAQVDAPFLQGVGNSGTGVSLSFAIEGSLSDRLHLSLTVKDAFSRLTWADQKHEVLKLDSAVQTQHPDSSIDYGPIVTGKANTQTLVTRAFTRTNLRLDWQLSSLASLLFEATHVAGLSRAWLGYQHGHWQMAFDPLSHSLRVALRGSRCAAMLSGDSLHQVTRNRALGLACTLPL